MKCSWCDTKQCTVYNSYEHIHKGDYLCQRCWYLMGHRFSWEFAPKSRSVSDADPDVLQLQKDARKPGTMEEFFQWVQMTGNSFDTSKQFLTYMVLQKKVEQLALETFIEEDDRCFQLTMKELAMCASLYPPSSGNARAAQELKELNLSPLETIHLFANACFYHPMQENDNLYVNAAREFCAACHKPGDNTKVCPRCSIVYYCSRACLKKHWKDHKKLCEALKKVPKKSPTARENVYQPDGHDWPRVLDWFINLRNQHKEEGDEEEDEDYNQRDLPMDNLLEEFENL